MNRLVYSPNFKAMKFPTDIEHIVNDRETGSVGLLNKLIPLLEEELKEPAVDRDTFNKLLLAVRNELGHFAAIENFLGEFSATLSSEKAFPENGIEFLKKYSKYWDNSSDKIADNVLSCCNPKGKIILTHSHSETVISLFKGIHDRNIPFRVLQTVSSPGEEGRVALERMHSMGISVDLIVDAMVDDVLEEVDLIVIGCDAILGSEFLNKTGTRYILGIARQLKIPTLLVAESRKEIKDRGWKERAGEKSLFEWVPLELVGKIISETKD